MYVINNHEVLIQVIYGDETTPSGVGMEIVPPLNESERTFIKGWMGVQAMTDLIGLVDQLSGGDVDSYGEVVLSPANIGVARRKIFNFATAIRRAIELQGQEASIVEQVHNVNNDDILGT